MNDTWHSFFEWWKEKTSSSLYFTYIISFLVWNWKSVYVLIMGSPNVGFWFKLEYIARFLPCTASGWLCSILNHSWVFIPPVIITFVIIKWLPILNRIVHKIEVEEYFKRKGAYDTAKTRYNSSRIKELETQVGTKEKEIELVEKISKAEEQINKNLTQEEKWNREFHQFKNTKIYLNFESFLKQVYGGYNYTQNFDSESIAIADAFSLIDIEKDDKVYLSDKGKYFSKLFSQESAVRDGRVVL